jgi:hypothetical protein
MGAVFSARCRGTAWGVILLLFSRAPWCPVQIVVGCSSLAISVELAAKLAKLERFRLRRREEEEEGKY